MSIYDTSMSETANIVIPVYPGVLAIDLIAAAAVFIDANAQADKELYAVHYLCLEPDGFVVAANGAKFGGDPYDELPDKIDMLIIAGALSEPLLAAMGDYNLIETIRKIAQKCSFKVCVSSGVFLLAKTGLISGRQVTTHWSAIDGLKFYFPEIDVVDDCLFVQDDDLWSSAGMLSGIDLALQILRVLHGNEIAVRVAHRLVLYHVRHAGQSQFSLPLKYQSLQRQKGANELVAWLLDRLDMSTTVADMAAFLSTSERSIHRLCRHEHGISPAQLLKHLRLDRACQLLVDTNAPLKSISQRCGFTTSESFSKSFLKSLGVTPNVYRLNSRTIL